MRAGRFITLEGGEGVGKSTNLAFIRDYLTNRRIDTLFTREPGGTPLGESIRSLLLSKGQDISCQTELLLVFAARAQHLDQLIIPALQAGRWVVCDRFTDASYAYQGGGRQLDSSVIGFLESWIQTGLQPDLTLFLDAPVEIGMARVHRRGGTDRFESEQIEFFERVRHAYLKRAADDPARIKRIDASQSLVQVQAELVNHLDTLLEA